MDVKMLGLCVLVLIGISSSVGEYGGWKDLDTKSEDVRLVAGYALDRLNEKSNSLFRSVLVEVQDAKRQTVAGLKYQLTLISGESDCMKNHRVENVKTDCKVSKIQQCKVTVLVQPWKDHKELLAFNCGSLLDIQMEDNMMDKSKNKDYKPEKGNILPQMPGPVMLGGAPADKEHKPEKGNILPQMPGPVMLGAPADKEEPHHVLPLMPGPVMPGAPVQGNTEDKGAKDAALFFLNDLNAKSNSVYKAGLVKIKSVSTQVVAGVKYIIKLEIGPTECQNTEENKDVGLEECPVTDSAQSQECDIEIWDQAWEKPRYQVLKSSCGTQTPPNPNVDVTMDQSTAEKEHLIGGNSHMAGALFRSFQKKYKKMYKTKKEEVKRFGVFRDNLRRIRKLNEQEMGTAVYKVNEFADLTYEEFKKQKLGFKPELAKGEAWPQADIPKDSIPQNFDWRDHNAVTPVKNQGSCGSCWAFSTTGNVEGQWAIKKSKLVSLSEQELVDCDKIDQGCEGGLPSNAYHEIMRLGGLETEKAYPYEGEDEKCHFKKSMAKVDINGAVNISTNEGDMAAWLFKNGPISIGINAFAMQFYFGGISHPWKIFCNPESLDHGVLIVGYGVKSGEPYWIVKNSWGPSWGEQGYYLVYRGGGVCGLNRMPTSAVVN